MSDIPMLKLNDGNTIPQLGFGTYQVDPEDTVESVSKAIEVGYRHIDTAQMYGNEKEVGQAVAQSGIDRSEFFITSKLNNSNHEPADAEASFNETLQKLGGDYIDLFIIHWPLPTKYDGDFISTWKVMEGFKKDNRAKSIGVSNFQVEHLVTLAQNSDVTPAINQIELHPFFQNRDVAAYGAEHGILTEAWSPIAQGEVMDDETIKAIADSIGKTPAQVTLRWHIQKGYIVFPKSNTPERIESNFQIFDFELNEDQVKQIDDLDKGDSGRMGPNPDDFDYIPE